jgi:hypothetical protein
VRLILRNAAVVASAGILCGFNSQTLQYTLNAYRGQPVRVAIARLGYPIQRERIEGKKLYYWWIADGGRYSCSRRSFGWTKVLSLCRAI